VIPNSGSKFAPGLSKSVGLKKGMKVKIMTEPQEKTWKDGKKSFLFCDVEYNGAVYGLAFNKTTYYAISNEYGEDTAEWISKDVTYDGMHNIKSPMGNVQGHVWLPVEEVIDLNDEKASF